MKATDISDNRMRADLVNKFEREFLVVWEALNMIGANSPFGDLMRLEVDRAADTLVRLMRTADCIDPTIRLDGTERIAAHPADA